VQVHVGEHPWGIAEIAAAVTEGTHASKSRSPIRPSTPVIDVLLSLLKTAHRVESDGTSSR
jgi:hypothetical protein